MRRYLGQYKASKEGYSRTTSLQHPGLTIPWVFGSPQLSFSFDFLRKLRDYYTAAVASLFVGVIGIGVLSAVVDAFAPVSFG